MHGSAAEDSGGLAAGRRSRQHELSASAAASDEQGHLSMCSLDGFFINITEDVLNKSNDCDGGEVADGKQDASKGEVSLDRTQSPKT